MASISAEERADIQDLVGRYIFAVDSGDHAGVTACFTRDGAVRYGTGEAYEGAEGLQRFAAKAIGGEEIRGRMHLNYPLFFRRDGAAIVLTSYLSTAQWRPPAPPTSFGSLRYVEDRCVLTPEGWRIAERTIFLWNSDTVAEIGARHRALRTGPSI